MHHFWVAHLEKAHFELPYFDVDRPKFDGYQLGPLASQHVQKPENALFYQNQVPI